MQNKLSEDRGYPELLQDTVTPQLEEQEWHEDVIEDGFWNPDFGQHF